MPSRSGMPSRLSSFVGRRKELGELRRLVAHTRLVMLLGPGGSGKTRLATEFARQQESRFPEGAIFAELGDISDGALVVEAIARAASIRLVGHDHLTTLVGQLQHRHLVVVDNCEHLVESAAEVVTRLLTGCPQLTVIATSRERLNIEGETVYTVPPLGVPVDGLDVATADSSDAARLLVDRARSVRPGFLLDASNSGAVLTICRRLDGMPLAIELAAARMTTLSPQDIVPRLEDSLRLLSGGSRNAVSRQQTLRATIDWSYQLLDLNEQRLLQRMSVFAGSPSADAVQEVCSFPPLDRATVLDALTRLVEKSMVQVDAGEATSRYRLVATIRDYAAERLEAEGHATTAPDRHLARYQRLATEAYEIMKRRGAAAEHSLLWREMDDVRAALASTRGEPEIELDLLGCLHALWMTYAQVEGRERTADALSRAPNTTSLARAKAGGTYASLAGVTGWRGTWAITPFELSQLADDLGDGYMLAQQQLGFGYAMERQMGDLEGARRHMLAAVEGFEAVGASSGQAMAMGSLGSIEMQLDHLDEARRWVERAVDLTAAVDDRFGSIGAQFHLGHYELVHGSRTRALENFLAGLEFVDQGDTLSITYQVAGVACALAADDPRYALRLFAATDRLRAMLNAPLQPPWGPRVEQGAQEARTALSEREADAASATAEGLTADSLLAEVRERFSARTGPRRKPGHGLSRREMEIAELVAAGMTSRAIAEKLFIAERTVETHLNHIMTKLDFSSRAQVAAWVVEQRGASAPGG
jgi:predicted ATPase/DNA-binding CsgD family transcriptional regulator